MAISCNTYEEFGKEINVKNELLQFVAKGRLDVFRSYAIHSPLTGSDFQKAEGLIYYSTGIDNAIFNGIIEDSEGNIPSDEEIDRVIDYFNTRKLPFVWWTSAKNLENKGFQFGEILTGIILDISQGVPAGQPPSNQLKIKIIQEEVDLKTFSELLGSAFDINTQQLHAVTTVVTKQGEQLNFLAYLNKTPVGTVTLSTFPSSSGIWNLSTLPDYQKHGIGTALVQAALLEAQKRNYKQVMSLVMPKVSWGLFKKLGFKEVCQYTFYVYGTSADKLEK